MTTIMKQRLIGSLLLLCVISGFAIFLMNKAVSERTIDTVIEEVIQPDFVSSIEVIPEDAIELEPETFVETDKVVNSNDDNEQDIEHTIPAPAPAPAPAPTDNVTKSWIIQLASFTAKENAQSLQNTVVKMGYTSTIETTNTAGTTYYRVRIGPEDNKQHVDKIVADVIAKLKINPQVISQ